MEGLVLRVWKFAFFQIPPLTGHHSPRILCNLSLLARVFCRFVLNDLCGSTNQFADLAGENWGFQIEQFEG